MEKTVGVRFSLDGCKTWHFSKSGVMIISVDDINEETLNKVLPVKSHLEEGKEIQFYKDVRLSFDQGKTWQFWQEGIFLEV